MKPLLLRKGYTTTAAANSPTSEKDEREHLPNACGPYHIPARPIDVCTILTAIRTVLDS